MVKRHLMNNKLAITLAASIAMTTVGGGVSAPLYAKESKAAVQQVSTPSDADRAEEPATPSDAVRKDKNTVREPKTEDELITPKEGLVFNEDEKEYAQLSESVEVPETIEVWAKLKSGEDRRQIILGNYGGGTLSWSIEVNADNTLRYWECRSDGRSLSNCKFDGTNNEADINICTDEWMLITIV